MRQPTVGAFAVVALVFTIGVQVSALTIAIDRHHGTAALLVSVLTGRVAVAVTCAVPTQPARPEGLGALVVGSVPRARAVVVVAGAAVLAVAAGLLDPHAGGLLRALVGIVGLAAGLLAAEGVRRLAARRIGGLNGDVLGSLVEVATTVSLLVVAL
jgi:adenosylcobinamide-GDP ribazoletransferase